MKLTVYRQATTERSDGTIVYKGEDARPYAGEGIFFVADGLGGASAIRHQKFDKDLFDEEKFADVLFKGIFEGYNEDEEFMDYLRTSFSEFHAIKHCYFDNVNNIKKSGYFASRIVAAILLRTITEIEEDRHTFREGGVFDLLATAESEEKRREIIKSVGEYFTDAVRTCLRAVSKKANLVYEGSFSGLSLLATTLCAGLYKEREDYVEVIYLVAGDCKPYYWSRDGFYQMIADQEGKDGGMTNYICANEDKEFFIESTYRRFDKPCVLFSASDGCFDSSHFFSPIAFEKLLLDSIIASEDMDGVQSKLQAFFEVNGAHDDSSTIALLTFGYDSFEALRADALARAEALDNEYSAQLDGVLTHNYTKELADGRNLVNNVDNRLPSLLMRSEGVKSYVTKAMLEGGYEPFDAEAREIDERNNNALAALAEAKAEVMAVVDRHFIPVCEQMELDCVTAQQLKRSNELSDEFDELVGKLNVATEECDTEFTDAAEFIMGELSCLGSVDKCWDYASYLSFNFEGITACREKIERALDFIKSIEMRKNPIIDKMNRVVAEFYNANRKAAENSNGREDVFRAVLDARIDFTSILLVEEDDARLSAAIEAYRVAESEFNCGAEGEKEAIAAKHVKGYITENAQSIFEGMVDGSIDADPDLAEMFQRVKVLKDGKLAQLEEWAPKQMEIVASYDTEHLKFITPEEVEE